MYRDFKPIQPINEPDDYAQSIEKDEKLLLSVLQSEKDTLLKRLQSLESDLVKLKSSIANLTEEKNALLKEVDTLKAENEKLAKELRDALNERDKLFSLIKELENKFFNAVKEIKLNALLEMLDFIKKVLGEIVDSSYFPHEETIIRAISKVFETNLDIKGSIKIKVNPNDFGLFNRFFANLSEALKKEISTEIIQDSTLSPGEFVIETPKFWIERKKDEVIEDAIRKALNDVQNI